MEANASKPQANDNVNVNVNVNEYNTPLGVVVGVKGEELLEAPGQYLHIEGVTDRQREMLMALEAAFGIVTDAARRININTSTHYRWLKQNEAYKIAVASMHEVRLDFAETQLLERIRKGDTAAIIFFLKTQGKGRGYIERTEVTGMEGGPVIQIAGNI